MLTQENPMQAIAPLRMSATIAGYELAVGKYAWNLGECQWVTCVYKYKFKMQSSNEINIAIKKN